MSRARVLKMAALSFPGGMPLGLVVTTIPAWLAHQEVRPSEIGLLQLAGLPWSLKFLWAPMLDRVRPPLFDRRRGWIAMMQLALVPAIGALALVDAHAAMAVGIATLVIALLSATQDIAMDAYAVEVLKKEEHGPGGALRTTFYRLAMLASGGLAIAAADLVSWRTVFFAIALAFLPALGLTALAEAPEPSQAEPPRSFAEAVKEPVRALSRRAGIGWLLALLVLYKFGDNVAASMVQTFFIQSLHIPLLELGTIQKVVGVAGTITGTLIGGALVPRMGLGPALWIFGVAQAVSNLAYAGAAWSEGYRPMVYGAIALEALAAGMGTAALVTLILRSTDKRSAAAQFALLSSVQSLSRTLAAPPGGLLAEALPWPVFFVASTLLGIPGLFVLSRVAPLGQREPRGVSEG